MGYNAMSMLCQIQNHRHHRHHLKICRACWGLNSMYNKSIKKNTTFPSFFISWNFFVIFFLKYHFLMWMKWLWYPNSYNTRFFICFWTCFIFKFCQISTIFATTFWLVDNPNVHIASLMYQMILMHLYTG